MANALVAVVFAAGAHRSVALRAVAVCTIAVTAGCWIDGYRRGRFGPRHDIVLVLALVTLGLSRRPCRLPTR